VTRLALLLALLAAGCGGSYVGDEPDLSEPEAMMLRLSDLPPGFRHGDERGCSDRATTDGHDPELDEFLLETRPRWCVGDFSREWGGPPRSLESSLFLFDSDKDAKRAWPLRKRLFDNFGRIFMTTERARGDVVPFDSDGLQQFGAGEAWRDGRVVVAVYEEGLSGEDGRAFASDLAAKQRHRIDSPSDPAEEDVREIALDDPTISIPVYWLGREFEPEGLGKLELSQGDHLRGEEAGNQVEIDYEGEGSSVTLDLWKPEAWRSSRCARRTELEVDGGRAEIHAGCRPNRWRAYVRYDEVVVAVRASGPYDSRDGMEAVVRGLRRR
jgi:hypothetical protein